MISPPVARQRSVPLLLALPLLLLLAFPVALLAFRASPVAFASELRAPETRSAIALSLATSSMALALSVLLGLPLALWLSRHRSRFAALIETLVDLPTVLPPSVAGVALLLAFGRSGPLGPALASLGLTLAFTPAAVIIAQVFVAAPYFVRAARAGFASIDPDLLQAALIDGASGPRLVLKVLLPLAGRSLGAGVAMTWSRAVGEFGATMIFAGNLPGRTQTMPLAVYLGFESDVDKAIVLSTILIAIALTVLIASRLLGLRIQEA